MGQPREGFLSQALYFVKLMGMDVFCLLDTRINYDAAESLVKAFSFDFEIVPSLEQCGGIILLWNNKKINILALSSSRFYSSFHLVCHFSLYDSSKGKPTSHLE